MPNLEKFLYANELEEGELYRTIQLRSKSIYLFNVPENSLATKITGCKIVGELSRTDYFVLLEVRKLPFCFKILTTSGIIGWTAELINNRERLPYTFKKPEV